MGVLGRGKGKVILRKGEPVTMEGMGGGEAEQKEDRVMGNEGTDAGRYGVQGELNRNIG